jgi:hypothetical protein
MSFNSDTLIISIPRQPIFFFVHIPLWYNTMAKTKGKAMIYKTGNRKLKIEYDES